MTTWDDLTAEERGELEDALSANATRARVERDRILLRAGEAELRLQRAHHVTDARSLKAALRVHEQDAALEDKSRRTWEVLLDVVRRVPN